MKRKFRVFLSSTFRDFKEARHRLILETLKLGHIPAGMELFQPGDERNIDVIRRDISSSDIFVILVGDRLGSTVPDEERMTFVDKEYDIAVECDLPIIPFLLDGAEPQREPLLQEFCNKVVSRAQGGTRIAGYFSYDNIDDLCGKYAAALNNEVERLIARDASGGWVDGTLYDKLRAHIILGDAASDNIFFEDFARRLDAFDKLSRRTKIEGPSKAAIADYFWEQYMPRIDEMGITHIYLESGSSIAYVSRSFIRYFHDEEWPYAKGLDSRLHIRTNNLLTYLQFLLVDTWWRPMDIQLMPYGPFSADYGATYGRLKSTRKMNSPMSSDEPRILPDDAAREIETLSATLKKAFARTGLVLMATSGIEIDPKAAFPGPHVGSPYNMLLKRCLLGLPCPKVMFLDDKKWNYSFKYNRCHPVCDSQFTWDYVKHDTPLAIALAAQDRARRDELTKSLREEGFTRQEVREVFLGEKGVWPIIAANECFLKFFQQPRTAAGKSVRRAGTTDSAV